MEPQLHDSNFRRQSFAPAQIQTDAQLQPETRLRVAVITFLTAASSPPHTCITAPRSRVRFFFCRDESSRTKMVTRRSQLRFVGTHRPTCPIAAWQCFRRKLVKPCTEHKTFCFKTFCSSLSINEQIQRTNPQEMLFLDNTSNFANLIDWQSKAFFFVSFFAPDSSYSIIACTPKLQCSFHPIHSLRN